ncbi:unnamed protein product, partial [Polarella glacialis]
AEVEVEVQEATTGQQILHQGVASAWDGGYTAASVRVRNTFIEVEEAAVDCSNSDGLSRPSRHLRCASEPGPQMMLQPETQLLGTSSASGGCGFAENQTA